MSHIKETEEERSGGRRAGEKRNDRERQRFKHRYIYMYVYRIRKRRKRAPRATCRGKSSSPSLSHSTPELISKGEISVHKVCVRATSEDLMDSMSCASFEEEDSSDILHTHSPSSLPSSFGAY